MRQCTVFLYRFILDDDRLKEPLFVLSVCYCAMIRSLNNGLSIIPLKDYPVKITTKELQDSIYCPPSHIQCVTLSVARTRPPPLPSSVEGSTYLVWGRAACPRTGSFACWPPPLFWQVPDPLKRAQWPSVFPGSSLLAKSSSGQDKVRETKGPLC